jgi:hypothetical protein
VRLSWLLSALVGGFIAAAIAAGFGFNPWPAGAAIFLDLPPSPISQTPKKCRLNHQSGGTFDHRRCHLVCALARFCIVPLRAHGQRAMTSSGSTAYCLPLRAWLGATMSPKPGTSARTARSRATCRSSRTSSESTTRRVSAAWNI